MRRECMLSATHYLAIVSVIVLDLDMLQSISATRRDTWHPVTYCCFEWEQSEEECTLTGDAVLCALFCLTSSC